MDRYLDDPALSQIAFRDGCFYTGDTGHLMKDGMLVVTGREKDVLNLGGDKVRPQAIEDVLTAFEGISQAAAFTMPNQIGHRRGLRLDRPGRANRRGRPAGPLPEATCPASASLPDSIRRGTPATQ